MFIYLFYLIFWCVHSYIYILYVPLCVLRACVWGCVLIPLRCHALPEPSRWKLAVMLATRVTPPLVLPTANAPMNGIDTSVFVNQVRCKLWLLDTKFTESKCFVHLQKMGFNNLCSFFYFMHFSSQFIFYMKFENVSVRCALSASLLELHELDIIDNHVL